MFSLNIPIACRFHLQIYSFFPKWRQSCSSWSQSAVVLRGRCRHFFLAPHNIVGSAALLFAASDLSMPRALWVGMKCFALFKRQNKLLLHRCALNSAPHTGAQHVRGFFLSVSWPFLFIFFANSTDANYFFILLIVGNTGVFSRLWVKRKRHHIPRFHHFIYPG